MNAKQSSIDLALTCMEKYYYAICKKILFDVLFCLFPVSMYCYTNKH